LNPRNVLKMFKRACTEAGAQRVQEHGWHTPGQGRPDRRQISLVQRFGDGQRHVGPVPTVSPGGQARQAGGGQLLPEGTNRGVGRLIKEHHPDHLFCESKLPGPLAIPPPLPEMLPDTRLAPASPDVVLRSLRTC
jgi:hypothetical protein